MVSGKEKFGAFIRREREGKGIGLREMARMIGVSPTYLSMVERDAIAAAGGRQGEGDRQDHQCDADDLLARAGRLSTDIADIIKRRPVELAALLRTTKGLTGRGNRPAGPAGTQKRRTSNWPKLQFRRWDVKEVTQCRRKCLTSSRRAPQIP